MFISVGAVSIMYFFLQEENHQTMTLAEFLSIQPGKVFKLCSATTDPLSEVASNLLSFDYNAKEASTLGNLILLDFCNVE